RRLVLIFVNPLYFHAPAEGRRTVQKIRHSRMPLFCRAYDILSAPVLMPRCGISEFSGYGGGFSFYWERFLQVRRNFLKSIKIYASNCKILISAA
ncbi:TPA: hypothetical protein ACFOA3_001750, partial [Neisseria meningitidis]